MNKTEFTSERDKLIATTNKTSVSQQEVIEKLAGMATNWYNHNRRLFTERNKALTSLTEIDTICKAVFEVLDEPQEVVDAFKEIYKITQIATVESRKWLLK